MDSDKWIPASKVRTFLIEQCSERNPSLDNVLDLFIKQHTEPAFAWDATRGCMKHNSQFEVFTKKDNTKALSVFKTQDKKNGGSGGIVPVAGHVYIRLGGIIQLHKSSLKDDEQDKSKKRVVYDERCNSCMRLPPTVAYYLHKMISAYMEDRGAYIQPQIGKRQMENGESVLWIPKVNAKGVPITSIIFQGGSTCPCTNSDDCKLCGNENFLSPNVKEDHPLYKEYIMDAKRLHYDVMTLSEKNFLEYKVLDDESGWTAQRREGTSPSQINNLMAKTVAMHNLVKKHGEAAVKENPTLNSILEEVRNPVRVTDMVFEIKKIYPVQGGHFQIYGRPVFSIEYLNMRSNAPTLLIGRQSYNLRLDEQDNVEPKKPTIIGDAVEEILPSCESESETEDFDDVLNLTDDIDEPHPTTTAIPQQEELSQPPTSPTVEFSAGKTPPLPTGKKRPAKKEAASKPSKSVKTKHGESATSAPSEDFTSIFA